MKDLKAIVGALYYVIGMLLGGSLIMPLMAFWVSNDGEKFYRQYDPWANSIFLFVSGVWILITVIRKIQNT